VVAECLRVGLCLQLSRVFSRIRDHENIVSEGNTVQGVLKQRQQGIDYDAMMDQREAELQEMDDEEPEDLLGFPTMPTEAEIARARRMQPAEPYNEEDPDEADDEEEDLEVDEEAMDVEEVAEDLEGEEPAEFEDEVASHFDEEDMMPEEDEEQAAEKPPVPQTKKQKQEKKKRQAHMDALERQTLLFSATALEGLELMDKKQGRKAPSKAKLMGTLKGLATGCNLPNNLKE
jgi:hypothetical protein